MTPPLVECDGLVHIYKTADLEVVALQGLDMRVAEGEMVAIVGRSGSGKTTLMNVLAAVEMPSAGKATVAGSDLTQLAGLRRDRYRRDVVGYLWQESMVNLTPQLTLDENVQLPLLAARRRWGERRARARQLLEAFGLWDQRDRLPGSLSGGERQLLALSVAVANHPALLLADEPTAELDHEMAGNVLGELRNWRQREGGTVVMVTHDRQVESFADRVLRIRDGRTSTEASATTGELVIIDRAGRLQLPRHVIEETGLGDRARVRVEGGRVLIEPSEQGDGGI
jgi:ABC-type lipoprotein export system ATPase subunit